jgi:hypothetical protein
MKVKVDDIYIDRESSILVQVLEIEKLYSFVVFKVVKPAVFGNMGCTLEEFGKDFRELTATEKILYV